MAQHEGGHTPFSADVTSLVLPDAILRGVRFGIHTCGDARFTGPRPIASRCTGSRDTMIGRLG